MVRLVVFLLLSSLVVHYCAAFDCGHQPALHDDEHERERRMIIGGRVSDARHWPWQVQFTVGGMFACGGTIIAPRWILTAAHCPIANGSVRLAENPSNSLEIDKVFIRNFRLELNLLNNRSYLLNEDNFNNSSNDALEFRMVDDIQLVRLTTPLNFSDTVQPICLYDGIQPLEASDEGVVTGYGIFSEMAPAASEQPSRNYTQNAPHTEPAGEVHLETSEELRVARVSIFENDLCEDRVHNFPDTIPGGNGTLVMGVDDDHICAGAYHRGIDKGDSGGPLASLGQDGRYYQLGITSFGEQSRMNQDLSPKIFTRVSFFCEWIRASTEGEASCGPPTEN